MLPPKVVNRKWLGKIWQQNKYFNDIATEYSLILHQFDAQELAEQEALSILEPLITFLLWIHPPMFLMHKLLAAAVYSFMETNSLLLLASTLESCIPQFQTREVLESLHLNVMYVYTSKPPHNYTVFCMY